MADVLDLHKEAFKERDALNKRRMSDYKLATSYKYAMTDKDNKVLKGVIHTTMNRLKVFKSYVLASLGKADERIVVETEDEAFDTAEVEDFLKRAFRSADLKRFKMGEFGLDPFFDEQACMNGELAARVLFQEMPASEGKDAYLDTDITPWDTQYIAPILGADGLSQCGYEIKKTKAVIESEKWAQETGFSLSEKGATEIDLWIPEENIIYINGEVVFRQPNPYKFVPVCVQAVPIGTMMVAEDSMTYQMESIYFLVRDLINEYNRCLSILQTLNLLAIKPALTEAIQDAHEYDELTAPGSVTPEDAPNAVQIVPYGEARRAMILALQELNSAIDDGTLSRIMLGHIDVTEMSAVALVQVEQGQGQVYMPRLGSRGLLKKQISEMSIRQIEVLGITSFEIGVPGHKKTFKSSDLDGEYEIDFRYTNKSPETDFARLSMATQYKVSGLMDDLTILTDVMKRDDPDDDLRKMHRQDLRQISPTLRLYDGAKALLKDIEDGDEEAKAEFDILEATLDVDLDQIVAGNIPVTQPKEQPIQTPMGGFLPTTTGERTSAQKATDLQRTAGEEEEGQ